MKERKSEIGSERSEAVEPFFSIFDRIGSVEVSEETRSYLSVVCLFFFPYTRSK